MITLENVSKIYLKRGVVVSALKNINLNIYEHEYISIIGPSGSGKTTLLNIIGTIDNPTEGKIYIEREEVLFLKDTLLSKFRREKIGFVFQSFNLINDLKVWENVSLPLYYSGEKRKKILKEKALQILYKVGLEKRVEHFPTELSAGEEQRVAIARALINNPKIILADEPTGNLDTKTSDEIIKLFEILYETERVTLIIVTHNPEISKRAKKIIHLVDGEIKNIKEN